MKVYNGRVLVGRVVDYPVITGGIHLLLEDEHGDLENINFGNANDPYR